MLLYKRCDMSKLVLYKNKDKVFEKDGTVNNNLFKVENITFNIENNIGIVFREIGFKTKVIINNALIKPELIIWIKT